MVDGVTDLVLPGELGKRFPSLGHQLPLSAATYPLSDTA